MKWQDLPKQGNENIWSCTDEDGNCVGSCLYIVAMPNRRVEILSDYREIENYKECKVYRITEGCIQELDGEKWRIVDSTSWGERDEKLHKKLTAIQFAYYRYKTSLICDAGAIDILFGEEAKNE